MIATVIETFIVCNCNLLKFVKFMQDYTLHYARAYNSF